MKTSKLTESQKGKIAQDLLAHAVVIDSDGMINVALPVVDDEAVDLMFYFRGNSPKVLFTQVKSRWLTSKTIKRGVFRSQVRKSTFHPRANYCVIFVVCDQENLQLENVLWLVPSLDFQRLTRGQKKDKIIVFQSGFNSHDMWTPYRIRLTDLSEKIKELLRI